ncbi:uncharacterized protein LOC117123231 [Anneissia japonica]|uniref:uncharacterized protein LOC117123231 n=1 Tax=Anneissia japonica TaxID=1529436 RepID=UPI001425A071|nr:uncharacterized protein LOC117123231 [Anneissia japonica]
MTVNMDISKGFAELKLLVSNWCDKHISINMLKVLYRDHVKDTFALHESSKTIELIDMLISSGNLSPNNLTLLYDTIKATEKFGLEQEIHTQLPLFTIPKNIRDGVITKFTPHRQRLVKLGMALTPSDVQKISELYDVKHTDRWSLIMDLEHNLVICEENMTAFIEKLKKHKLCQAVKALTEGIPMAEPSFNSGQTTNDIPNATSNIESGCGEGIAVTICKRKRGPSDSDGQPYRKYALDLLNDLDEHKDCLTLKDVPEFYEKFENLIIYYERYGLKLTKVGKGSIVFYLIANDPNALMNLWEVHSSGKLIKDLAGILVPEKHQQEFLDEWMTCIDETEYKAALSKLKGKDEKAPISEVSELSVIPEVEECAPYFTKELETKLIAVEGDSAAILQCAVAGIPRPQVLNEPEHYGKPSKKCNWFYVAHKPYVYSGPLFLFENTWFYKPNL